MQQSNQFIEIINCILIICVFVFNYLGNYGSVKAIDAAQYGETSLASGVDGGKLEVISAQFDKLFFIFIF